MTKGQVRKASLPELIDAYETAAAKHGAATERGDFRTANPAADLLGAIYSELRRRGGIAQEQLLPLLWNQDLWVRLWTSSHALEFSAERALPVLESLARKAKFLGFNAQLVLKEWQAGRLRFQ